MTIAGNFQTETEEIKIVKEYLNKEGLSYKRVYKYPEASAGDVMVVFENGLYALFEVKQESCKRFQKYGEYGIDFLSAFKFKPGVDENAWKTIHNPRKFDEFLGAIDFGNETLKLGKLAYSYSDVWLFYVKDNAGNTVHLECYEGKKVETQIFFDYLRTHCQFAINKKTDIEMSNTDTWHSATFFIKPEKMVNMKVDPKTIFHNEYMLSIYNSND